MERESERYIVCALVDIKRDTKKLRKNRYGKIDRYIDRERGGEREREGEKERRVR